MYPPSDHYKNDRFFNPWGANIAKTFWDVLKWKLSGQAKVWKEAPIRDPSWTHLVQKGQAASLHVTYIGHASTYIQNDKLSILTDPQFSERASPIKFLGPKRFQKPALTIEELPGLDAVVISHNHYDHLDLPSLVALHRRFQPAFYVPLGNARYLQEAGIDRVIELDWWQSKDFVQLVPVQHWSARGVRDRNRALWGGFVLTLSQKKIFFAGDTGYGPHFKMIRDQLGPMDLSILPIGAYEPRDFMKTQHMNPEDAVQAHLDLDSKQSFAIHFETFQLTDEGFDEPRTCLEALRRQYKMSEQSFFVPRQGETLIVPT